jgi:hypothetical protein
MTSPLPMVLICDRDFFSNSTLSHELRRQGLAENIICTTSASNALAYLYKQQICNYPFPDYIIYNPSNLQFTSAEFIDSYRVAFSDYHTSKFILLEEKNYSPGGNRNVNSSLIKGRLTKPISPIHLKKIFTREINKPIVHKLD